MSAGAPARVVDAERLEAAWSPRPGLVGWLGQCNHKAVGRRYIVTSLVVFVIAGLMALAMRAQLAGPDLRVMSPELYGQLFTLHGTLMMFFFAVPMLEGIAIYVLPLQLGARDMPMPRLNAFGYWLYLTGVVILLASFVVGSAPGGGWYAYPPLTSDAFSPGVSIDLWLFGVTLTEVAAIVASIEIATLILRHRAAGMSVARMPLFAWANLATAIMILVAFPPLVITSLLLEAERKFGLPFFDPAGGGDPLLWQHLFWWFGHPEVYIQLLPSLGILAAVITVATRRKILGRWLVVGSFLAIAIVSFGLWVHHMFTVGIPQVALQFFSAASFMITIPTAIVVFAFLASFWTGGIRRWEVDSLFVVGFLIIFVFGGITGVMVSVVAFNWQIHDTYFVVGHFHSVLIGGVVFPIFAGLYHWFPLITGRYVNRGAGIASFVLMTGGFLLTFVPQHVLGFLGMVRRTWTYGAVSEWGSWNLASSIGSVLLGLGVLVSLVAFAVAWKWGRPAPLDPWGAPTLEWGVPGPPPQMNMAALPIVDDAHPRWHAGSRPSPLEGTDWYHELGDPTLGRRETLVTSPIHGDPEAIVVLPGHSLWPLGSALALGLMIVAALVDSIPLLLIGAVGMAATTVGWLWPGVVEEPVYELADSADSGHQDVAEVRPRFRPIGDAGRTHGWWGSVLGLVVVGHLVAAVLVAGAYLRAGSHRWPEMDLAIGGPTWGQAGVVLAALLALALVVLAHRLLRRGLVAPAGWTLLVAGVLAGAGALGRTMGLQPLDMASQHVWLAILWIVGSVDIGIVGLAGVMAGIMGLHVLAGRVPAERHADVSIVALWTAGAAVVVCVNLVAVAFLSGWWS